MAKKNLASTKDIACKRLKIALAYESNSISPTVAEMLRFDLMRIVESYIDFDHVDFKLQVKKMRAMGKYSNVLTLLVPIRSVKTVKTISYPLAER